MTTALTWPARARSAMLSARPPAFSRSTAMPPIDRNRGARGPQNISFFPSQTGEMPLSQAIASIKKKSQFDVCGAATRTQTGSSGGVPVILYREMASTAREEATHPAPYSGPLRQPHPWASTLADRAARLGSSRGELVGDRRQTGRLRPMAGPTGAAPW